MSTNSIIPKPAFPVLSREMAAPKVAFASEDEERQARERYAIIEPLLNFQACPSSGTGAGSHASQQLGLGLQLTLADGRPVRNASTMEEYLAQCHELSRPTIRRWVSRYRKGGMIALADRTRSDKGFSRFFAQHQEAAVHAAYVYLVQRRSARIAFEAIVRDRENLGVQEEELPSYETVRMFLRSIPPAIETLARNGYRAYRERMAPYVSRGYVDVPANEIWVSDHMIHDVEVKNDFCLDAPMGAPIRLRFTAIIDFRSRMVVGTSWAWDGSSHSITTALRHAVTTYGPAATLYCDNGKDYLKVAKGAMPATRRGEMEPDEWYKQEIAQLQKLGVLARLGMTVQHCIVRHPQSKHIERFFGFMHERFDKCFPTYTGPSPARRPDITEAAMAQHRKLLRMGRSNESLHPRASQFIAAALIWIDWYNREHKHSGEGMSGRTPAEVFNECRGPARPIPDRRELTLMLMERERRAVRECAVRLNNRRYLGADEPGRRLLHDLNERNVIIAYDPLDPSEAAILDLDGNFLTFAVPDQPLPQSPAAHEAIGQSMAERRRMERDTRELILGIRDTARANGAESEVEHLVKRASVLPMAVGEVYTRKAREVRVRPDVTAVAPPSPEDAAQIVNDMED